MKLRRSRRASQPRPPENVRIVYADGRVIPVECRYEGVREGIHVWVAVLPSVAIVEYGMQIQCDLLPAHTTVGIPVRDERPR